jgi:hypothetical protein
MRTIERVIHFYEITFPGKEIDEYRNTLREIFNQVIELNKNLDKTRIDNHTGYLVCMKDVQFIPERELIKGKILRISMDAFPEIIDILSDNIRAIDAEEEDGIVETAHFVINYSNIKRIILALEHNNVGGKSGDYQRYVSLISNRLELGRVLLEPYVRDELETFIERIQKCSYFRARVKKENLDKLENFDKKLYTALDTARELGKSDTVEIMLNFDYRKKNDTPTIRQLINNIVRRLLKDRSYASCFEVLETKAEDAFNSHRLEVFDLISDKLKSLVRVERKDKEKVVVSADMFLKLEEQLNRHFK